jgi:hypothetical protein
MLDASATAGCSWTEPGSRYWGSWATCGSRWKLLPRTFRAQCDSFGVDVPQGHSLRCCRQSFTPPHQRQGLPDLQCGFVAAWRL